MSYEDMFAELKYLREDRDALLKEREALLARVSTSADYIRTQALEDAAEVCRKRRLEISEKVKRAQAKGDDKQVAYFDGKECGIAEVTEIIRALIPSTSISQPAEPEKCIKCGHGKRFFYHRPDSGDTEPRCWHEDADGFCGCKCEFSLSPERVDTPPDQNLEK